MVNRMFFLFYTLLGVVFLSCGGIANHKLDGHYKTSIIIADVDIWIDGNKISIDNSATGHTELACTQYDDRIEYVETNGVKRIMKVLTNGDLEVTKDFVFKKVKDEDSSKKSDKNKQ